LKKDIDNRRPGPPGFQQVLYGLFIREGPVVIVKTVKQFEAENLGQAEGHPGDQEARQNQMKEAGRGGLFLSHYTGWLGSNPVFGTSVLTDANSASDRNPGALKQGFKPFPDFRRNLMDPFGVIAATPEAIERDAKARLNLKKPGEEVVVVIPASVQATTSGNAKLSIFARLGSWFRLLFR